jgi:uncharacterized membrane protein
MKFLHTLGAAGFMGGLGAVAVVLILASPAGGPGSDGALNDALARIAAWIIGPSMVVTVIAGLLGIAVHPGFHNAGWVWAKAATGVLIFEGGLHVMGPLQEAAKRGPGPHPGGAAAATLLAGEVNTLWLLLAVSAVNVALGVWRPRLPSLPV